MKPCQRIEIVIEEPLHRRMAHLLKDLGAPGYTLIPRASGLGDRGLRLADDPTGSQTNAVFIIACNDPDVVKRIIDGIRPMLSESGGMCIVSDAQWVRH